jgi:hypothetical protein
LLDGDKKETLQHKPLTLDFAEATLVKSLWWGNFATFAVVLAGAMVLVSWQSAASVAVGGLIALANFRLLELTIRHTLLYRPASGESPLRKVLTKYYLRFGATALLLVVLMRQGMGEPLGILVGLSVVVVTIMVWGIAQANQLSGRQ